MTLGDSLLRAANDTLLLALKEQYAPLQNFDINIILICLQLRKTRFNIGEFGDSFDLRNHLDPNTGDYEYYGKPTEAPLIYDFRRPRTTEIRP